MTAIAALEVPGEGVWIGSDSHVGDESWRDLMGPKWFRRGSILVASSGGLRSGQVTEYGTKFRRQRGHESDHEFVCVGIVEPMRQILHASGTKIGEDAMIIAYNGGAYWVDGEFGVHRSAHRYVTTGAGEHLAAGSLASTEGLPPRKRVESALAAAARHSPLVYAPFHLCFVPALPKARKAPRS